jgi:putative peptidoglycan lipid II flippase
MLTVIITLFIHVFLLLQNIIAASQFGISVQMDAYNVSFTLMTFIFSFLAVAVTTVLIPSLANQKTHASNTFITLFAIFSFLLVIILFLFGERIAGAFFQNPFIPKILYVLSIGFLFKAFTGILVAIYQVYDRYVLPKVVQAIASMCVVLLLVVREEQSILSYSFAIAFGFLLEFILCLYLLLKQKDQFRYRVSLDIKDAEFLGMVRSVIPVFFSTALYQLMLLINIAIAERLGEGNVSILTYSNQLYGMVNALFVMNLLTIMFPRLVKVIASNKKQSISRLEDYIIVIVTIMMMMIVEFFIHGKDAITLLFQRGEFDESVTALVYQLSSIYFLLLPFGAARDLLYRYFYADHDTLTPFRNSIVVSVINIILSLVLSQFLGLYGIVLGTVLAGVISFIMISAKFKKKYKIVFQVKIFAAEMVKILAISCFVILIGRSLLGVIPEFSLIVRSLILLPFTTCLYIFLLFICKGKIFSIQI